MDITFSSDHVSALRSVAKAGFGLDNAKKLALSARWQLTDGELDLGYLRFDIQILVGDSPRSLVVEFGKDDGPSFAFVPLLCFPDTNEQLTAFNAAFQSASTALQYVLGPPSDSGQYGYAHRKWHYSYCWWSLPEAELVLVQDEFDIQDGLDITLWILSAGTPRNLPVRP
jgi:hypothetical protein